MKARIPNAVRRRLRRTLYVIGTCQRRAMRAGLMTVGIDVRAALRGAPERWREGTLASAKATRVAVRELRESSARHWPGAMPAHWGRS